MEIKKKPFKKDVKPDYFLSGGQAATGALGGAASGAALGSIIPGLGTAFGAIGGGLLGGLGGLFGGGGGDQPQMPNITNPVTGEQITDQYGNIVATQQALQSFNQQLAAQQGVQNQSDIYKQYGQLATGQSPLAQAMLGQATEQNVAQQSALMASQRGAGANPALLARQAAQQGGQIQQQAAGQAATLQAQQQLAALQAQAGIAGQQVGQQQAGLQTAGQLGLGAYGQALGGYGAYNQALTGAQGGVNAINAQQQAQSQDFQNKLIGGGLQGIGAIASQPGLFGKGTTTAAATPTAPPPTMTSTASQIPTPMTAAHGGKVESPKLARVAPENRFPATPQNWPPHLAHIAQVYHPHEGYGHQREQRSFGGGHFAYGGDLKSGGEVPGKPKVSGDSLKNDTVPAMLSPGEVVIPKSVMESEDPVSGAAQFVAALQSKQSGQGGNHKEEFKEALRRAIAGRKNK